MADKPNATNVAVAKPTADGVIFVAPLGTALPQDALAPLGEEFAGLGYVSEDGIENAFDESSEDIKAFGGDTVLVVKTSRSETFTYTLIEALNTNVLKQVYGKDNVTEGKIVHNGADRGSWVYVIQLALTGGRVKRIVIPNATVKEIGAVTYKDSEPIGYENTLAALPDAVGNTAYEYISKISGGGED